MPPLSRISCLTLGLLSLHYYAIAGCPCHSATTTLSLFLRASAGMSSGSFYFLGVTSIWVLSILAVRFRKPTFVIVNRGRIRCEDAATTLRNPRNLRSEETLKPTLEETPLFAPDSDNARLPLVSPLSLFVMEAVLIGKKLPPLMGIFTTLLMEGFTPTGPEALEFRLSTSCRRLATRCDSGTSPSILTAEISRAFSTRTPSVLA
mmetsp:Transcript_31485/g.52888  ORF Transcript_31485/g.52888 Transcript_31485/m.52888 type:complete len:205 (-) Transcript_31485:203-817(-)